jgi:biopolymer transport protein ExbD
MINLQNKIKVETSSSSMSDLVFLLLIFFMITSTLISPNAIPLNLPESSSDTRVKQDLTVYITYQNEVAEFYIGEKPIAAASLQDELRQALEGSAPDAAVVVRADKSLPVEQVVYTLDAVEQINRADNENHKHKVTLATKGQ